MDMTCSEWFHQAVGARPKPERQKEMSLGIGEERSEDFSETLFIPEAKILAGGVAARPAI